jgi:hypothetical protein
MELNRIIDIILAAVFAIGMLWQRSAFFRELVSKWAEAKKERDDNNDAAVNENTTLKSVVNHLLDTNKANLEKRLALTNDEEEKDNILLEIKINEDLRR